MSDTPQGPYGAPQTGPYQQPPYGYPYAPPQPGTNTLAILALVFAFVFAPAAIVMGAIARKQIRSTGEQGWGLATAGFVCGIVFTALWVLWIVLFIAVFASVANQIPNQGTGGAVLLAGFGL